MTGAPPASGDESGGAAATGFFLFASAINRASTRE